MAAFFFAVVSPLISILEIITINYEERIPSILDSIPCMEYYKNMWEVEYTDEFGEWWETLSEAEQDAVAFTVGLLKR
jgi:hypothetical protein